ncbi:uncharacterized protein ASCRUDRAFT_153701 [Ascoidea rubescens DSM 1968]|uniref:F-box domain-containing protein n=1 Tax=Ascoidea rubescens DSM 1968 TaxID=1344418 RepID=A0A1D2VFW6_9ASCO|nr:hypothetical protein ASCRUDRAFT_153701 [Ascoidea rubescens DSM 1968]ODV60367.1 hypothetical protein ASCRUDRAFT_153701 [Ascoidea rubescens DSM 1968]
MNSIDFSVPIGYSGLPLLANHSYSIFCLNLDSQSNNGDVEKFGYSGGLGQFAMSNDGSRGGYSRTENLYGGSNNYTTAPAPALNKHIKKNIMGRDKDKMNGQCLTCLPDHLLLNICKCLNQYDALNFSMSCKVIFACTIERIYENVIIFNNYSEFNLEMIEYFNYSTFIKTKYNFKKFIKLILDEKKSFKYLKFIKRFNLINIPNNISDFESFKLIFQETEKEKGKMFLEKFQRIESINWNSINFPVLKLKLINYDSLKELRVHLNVTKKDKNLLDSIFNKDGMGLEDKKYYLKNLFPFKRLEKLEIIDYKYSIILRYIVESLLFNSGNGLSGIKKLKLVNLNFQKSMIYPNNNSLLNYHENENDNSKFQEEMKMVYNFFEPIYLRGLRFDNLRELELSGAIISNDNQVGEFELLNGCIDFERVEYLKFDELYEIDYNHYPSNIGINNANNVNNINGINDINNINDNHGLTFIEKFEKYNINFYNLKYLKINWKKPLYDHIPNFLGNLFGIQLRELDLVINLSDYCNNNNNNNNNNNWNQMIEETIKRQLDNYNVSLTPNLKKLRKLSIRINDNNIKKNISTNLILKKLNEFNEVLFGNLIEVNGNQLESLRINSNLNLYKIEKLSNFRKLNYLELIDLNSYNYTHNLNSNQTNNQLEIHNGVYDDWYKVQHIAFKLGHLNENLKFISVNGCIFEIRRYLSRERRSSVDYSRNTNNYQGYSSYLDTEMGSVVEAIPREGISEWFESKINLSSC